MLYNISFDIASLFIYITLLFVLATEYTLKEKTTRVFVVLVSLLLAGAVLDILTAVTISYADRLPEIFNLLFNTVFFLVSSLCMYVAVRYVLQSVRLKSRLNDILTTAVLGLYAVLLVANIFTGIIFSFAGRVYTHGPLFALNYLMPVYCLVVIAVVLLSRRKMFKKRQIISDVMLVVLAITGTALQMFVMPDVLLNFFMYSVSVTLMMFSLETPDYRELEYLRKNLQLEVEKQMKTAVEEKNRSERLSVEVIQTLAQTIDAKDEYTRGHSARVAAYSRVLALEIGWNEADATRLYNNALLHDIGKIGIPDAVLNKPGKLTPDEYKQIQGHTVIGYEILLNVPDLPGVTPVARSHHERWDGLGYPDGLKETQIPLDARIVSVADAYDAMTSRRVYREGLPKEYVREEFVKYKGKQFDPELTDVFISLLDSGVLERIRDEAVAADARQV